MDLDEDKGGEREGRRNNTNIRHLFCGGDKTENAGKLYQLVYVPCVRYYDSNEQVTVKLRRFEQVEAKFASTFLGYFHSSSNADG